MKRCKLCVMPDTRPGLMFNEQGVCQACVRYGQRAQVDWDARWAELVELAKPLKADNPSGYNCAIAVSGGKDSHAQVYYLKEILGLNPLLINVSNLPNDGTPTGQENFANLLSTFDCECVSLNLSPKTCRKLFRYCFEKYGSPTWYWDRAVYTFPPHLAWRMGIKTLFYGENVSYEYGGPEAEDVPYAYKQIKNNVARTLGENLPVDIKRLYLTQEVSTNVVDSRYLSYYIPWSGSRNRCIAESYGFKPLDEFNSREGFIEQYDQIDAFGYLVHAWMKYPKYGHARATDVASYWIRDGHIMRDRAMELVKEHDHKLDRNIRQAFCDFCGYTDLEFNLIVDKFYNRELFDEVNGNFILKEET